MGVKKGVGTQSRVLGVQPSARFEQYQAQPSELSKSDHPGWVYTGHAFWRAFLYRIEKVKYSARGMNAVEWAHTTYLRILCHGHHT